MWIRLGVSWPPRRRLDTSLPTATPWPHSRRGGCMRHVDNNILLLYTAVGNVHESFVLFTPSYEPLQAKLYILVRKLQFKFHKGNQSERRKCKLFRAHFHEYGPRLYVIVPISLHPPIHATQAVLEENPGISDTRSKIVAVYNLNGMTNKTAYRTDPKGPNPHPIHCLYCPLQLRLSTVGQCL